MSRVGCPTCGRWTHLQKDGTIGFHHSPDSDEKCAGSGLQIGVHAPVKATSNPSKHRLFIARRKILPAEKKS